MKNGTDYCADVLFVGIHIFHSMHRSNPRQCTYLPLEKHTLIAAIKITVHATNKFRLTAVAETRPGHGIRWIALHLVLYLLAQPSTMSLSHSTSSFLAWKECASRALEQWDNDDEKKSQLLVLLGCWPFQHKCGNVERDVGIYYQITFPFPN